MIKTFIQTFKLLLIPERPTKHFPVLDKMSNEKFDLRWNDFGRNAERTIRNLANDIQFTDVTLMSDDKRRIKAHKVILCSSSMFFNEILSETPRDNPLLFLKGIQYSELQRLSDLFITEQQKSLRKISASS